MILYSSLRNLLITFNNDKSNFEEATSEDLRKYFGMDLSENSKCFTYRFNWYMFVICDEKIYCYQYLKETIYDFDIDDIMNNDLDYNILKYGRIISEEI